MKKLFNLIIFLILFSSLRAQVETYTNYSFKGNFYDIIIAKADSLHLNNLKIVQNTNLILNEEFIKSLTIDSATFLINAYPFDSACNPIGYLCQDYQVVKDVNLADGNTNFFLKPNGLFLVTDKEAFIGESSQISNYQNIRLGFQSGPMLVTNGKIHPKFNQTSSNKNIRSGVGIFSKGNNKFIIFCLSSSKVTFYEFSELFKEKFLCTDALCLQSAGCTIFYPDISPEKLTYNGLICSYLFFHL